MSARILVVDDIVTNVKLLEAKLTREYFEVVTASDGPSALEAAAKHTPDIILLDVMMPGMDGYEVCLRLKKDPLTAHIPVVMITALSEISDRVRGLEVGADEFLTKPVDDLSLFARIKSLARLKTAMDEWRRRESTCDQFGVLGDETPVEMDITHARVLVIERSDVLCKRMAAALEPDETMLTVAASRAEALDLAARDEFDLMIVGALPEDDDGDSLRLCSLLRSREESRHLPILLMVEEDDRVGPTKGLELGVNDYIVKPLDKHEFVARARTQIRRKRYQNRLRDNFERSLSLALTDSLTGLYNHRYAGAHLRTVMEGGDNGRNPVGLLMIDIDYFKAVNDEHGHAVGDEVLCEIARRITDCVRNFDMVARLGGEEFVVALTDATPEIVVSVAERLRRTIAATPFKVSVPPHRIPVTVSVGAAMTGSHDNGPDALLRRADIAMYQAKRRGRNLVVADFEEDSETARSVSA